MQEILIFLNSHDDFIIIGHVSPDGDTIGSCVAMWYGLVQTGKKAAIYIDGDIPKKYSFITDGCKEAFTALSDRSYGAAIALDCGDETRLGKAAGMFKNAKATALCDHHRTNTEFAEINLVRGDDGATGLIVFDILNGLGVRIDERIANALYTAIATDTGNFQYSSTDEAILLCASKLRACGADITLIGEKVYRERTFAATKLIGRAVDRIALHSGGRIAATYILLSDYDETGAVKQDCDELINYAREIDTVEVAVFLRQVEPEKFKLSLRSSHYADVSKIALIFEGGGHARAAGGTMFGDVEGCIEKLVTVAEKYL